MKKAPESAQLSGVVFLKAFCFQLTDQSYVELSYIEIADILAVEVDDIAVGNAPFALWLD